MLSGLEQEGIFRMSGDMGRIQDLKLRYKEGKGIASIILSILIIVAIFLTLMIFL